MLRARTVVPALVALSLALGSLTPPVARAERLLAPVLLQRAPGGTPPYPGVSRVQPLALGRAALADLRGRQSATVEQFPIGQDGAVDLALTRFEPFTANARVEVMEATGVRTMPLPDQVYFRGSVAGKPGSHALVIAAPDGVHGVVSVDGEVYPFGPDGAGGHRGYAIGDVDAAVYPAPGDFCANDLRPDALEVPAESTGSLRAPANRALAAPDIAAATTLKQADVAIETDQELRAKFPSDQAALQYLASLAAAASAIYESDVAVRLRFSYIRLWNTTDPWTKTDTVDALYEVQNWWNTQQNGMYGLDRDLTHFISGKPVRGGVAYLSVLCNWYWAYGVSQVYGSFDLASPQQIWDVLVVTHELGHNFGSPHSHCYDPPLDHCWVESGCYAGPAEKSRGTIMSYCHLQQGGLANIDLEFGNTVSNRIGSAVASVSCLAPLDTGPACGNGAVEAGETCDDGNQQSGDCCSATCQNEPGGATCASDGNACTDDRCNGVGACVHPPNVAACDDGDSCTNGDACSNGVCTGTTFAECGPCYTCTPDGGCAVPDNDACEPALPKKSLLTIKDAPIDARDTVSWTWTGRNAVPKTLFGAPTAASDLTLCVYDASGSGPTLRFAASAPAGEMCGPKPCWSETSSGFKYADKQLTPDGILRAQLRAGGAGRAKISVAGKGANLALPAGPLVAPVTVRLERGDGQSCWSATYKTPSKNDTGQFRAKSEP